MSLFSQLQHKPESTRKKAVFLIAIGITLLIIVLWIPTLNTRFRTVSDERTTPQAPSPIGSFLITVRSLFSSFSYEAQEVLEESDDIRLLFEQLEEQEKSTTSPAGVGVSTTTAEGLSE